MAKYSPWKSRKVIITSVIIAGVMVGDWIRPGYAKDLEIVLPALAGLYHFANAYSKRFGQPCDGVKL